MGLRLVGRWSLVGALLVVAACTGDQVRPPSDGLDSGEAQVLVTTRVESLPVPGDLERPAVVAQYRDGFVVADRTEVRFFDSNWEQRSTLGRQGQGPREFENVVGIGVVGDTLYVLDGRLRRLSAWGPDATLLGTRVLVLPGEFPNLDALRGTVPVGPEGRLLVRAARNPGQGMRRDVALLPVNWESQPIHEPLWRVVEGPEWLITPGGNLAAPANPFGSRAVVAGSLGGLIAWGDGIEGCVKVARVGEGDIRSICLVDSDPVMVQWDAIRDLSWVPDERRPVYEQLLQVQEPSEILPKYDELWLPSENQIWVRRLTEAHASVHPHLPWTNAYERLPDSHWEVYDLGGDLVRRVQLPAWFTPHATVGDTVVGLMRDELGVRHLTQAHLAPMDG